MSCCPTWCGTYTSPLGTPAWWSEEEPGRSKRAYDTKECRLNGRCVHAAQPETLVEGVPASRPMSIAPKDRTPVWFAAFAAQMAQRLQAAPLAADLVRYIIEQAVIFADAAQRGLEAHDQEIEEAAPCRCHHCWCVSSGGEWHQHPGELCPLHPDRPIAQKEPTT